MGVVVQHRLLKADQLEQATHPVPRLLFGGDFVDHQGLGHRGTDPDSRVETGERILKDDLHGLSVYAHLLGFEGGDVNALEENPALVRVVETDDEVGQGGFSTTALSDHGEGLTVVDMKRYVSHSVYPAVVGGRELFRYSLHLDDGTLAVAPACHARSPARLNGLGPSWPAMLPSVGTALRRPRV